MIYLKSLNIENLNNKDEYPFNLPLFKTNKSVLFNKPITFITGDNGSGKSTLLENLAVKVGFNITGGNKNHSYQNHGVNDNLDIANCMQLTWNIKTCEGFFFRAESFFDFVKYIDKLAEDNGNYVFSPYGGKSLQNQSHGESFLSLFQNKFNKGLFILDEPEAALSPEKQLALLNVLNNLASTDKCQFIIATHSPILIACPNSETYEITNGNLIKTDYKSTKQFQFYKDFINSPERFLKYLFNDSI